MQMRRVFLFVFGLTLVLGLSKGHVEEDDDEATVDTEEVSYNYK